MRSFKKSWHTSISIFSGAKIFAFDLDDDLGQVYTRADGSTGLGLGQDVGWELVRFRPDTLSAEMMYQRTPRGRP